MLQLCNNAQEEQEKEEWFWKEPLGAWIKDCIIGSDALLPEAAWRTETYRGRALRFPELCDVGSPSVANTHLTSLIWYLLKITAIKLTAERLLDML
uniref:Uncharacterized protein n=1 Tax=Loa loa TaxID=7209 RepID=A0A1I7VEJ5_LOALO